MRSASKWNYLLVYHYDHNDQASLVIPVDRRKNIIQKGDRKAPLPFTAGQISRGEVGGGDT